MAHARARTSECVGIASVELYELIFGRLRSCDKDGARHLSAVDRQTEHEKTQQNEIDACRPSLALNDVRIGRLGVEQVQRPESVEKFRSPVGSRWLHTIL